MKKYTTVIFFTLFIGNCFLQTDSILPINRYGIGFLPSKAHNIYGLALGLMGSEVICDRNYTRKSHGLNIQLFGQGFFTPFNLFNKERSWYHTTEGTIVFNDSNRVMRTLHNGVLIAGFGTFTETINGVSISPWMSVNHKINGLSLNLFANSSHTLNGVAIGFYNVTYKTHGLQIGLVNRTRKLRGFQLGLWNVNEKRKLPLINWSFR